MTLLQALAELEELRVYKARTDRIVALARDVRLSYGVVMGNIPALERAVKELDAPVQGEKVGEA